MKPTKLIEPVIEENKWWEKYEELNSSLFTSENSARRMGCPEIYRLSDDEELIPIKYYEDKYSIVGYTLNPPLFPRSIDDDIQYIGIMFESTETFEKVWFHFCR
jgi:hypothetical protein